MRFRSNLFIKLFFSFWLMVFFTVIGSVYFERYFNEQHSFQSPHSYERPIRLLRHLFYDLQTEDLDTLQEQLKKIEQKRHIQVLLLNSDGKDIFDRQVDKRSLQLAEKLTRKRSRIIDRKPPGRRLAQNIYRQDTGLLKVIMISEPPPKGLSHALQQNLWARLTLAMLISGLLCYALAHWLTKPIRNLRSAAQKLAKGELDAPIPVRHFASDETDDLAQDFNIMSAQLQERIEAHQRLLRDVSHELRSPLARLQLALALAEKNTEKQSDYLQRVSAEALNLDELINQLLNFPNHEPSMNAHIDLVPLLETLCEEADFEGAKEGKQTRLHCDIGEAVLTSSNDTLYKAIGNVIRNAIKYTASDSTVDVTLARSADNHYRITVSDCGPGISEQELDKIFNAFYRVDTARTRKTGGYGLGLTIAKRAIEQHGGRIAAHNTRNGLCVEIDLPVIPSTTKST